MGNMPKVAIVATVFLVLGGCSSTGSTTKSTTTAPTSAKKHTGQQHEITLLRRFRNNSKNTQNTNPQLATDPEYQEYLEWKRWQEFKAYQEWKRTNQGQTDSSTDS